MENNVALTQKGMNALKEALLENPERIVIYPGSQNISIEAIEKLLNMLRYNVKAEFGLSNQTYEEWQAYIAVTQAIEKWLGYAVKEHAAKLCESKPKTHK